MPTVTPPPSLQQSSLTVVQRSLDGPSSSSPTTSPGRGRWLKHHGWFNTRRCTISTTVLEGGTRARITPCGWEGPRSYLVHTKRTHWQSSTLPMLRPTNRGKGLATARCSQFNIAHTVGTPLSTTRGGMGRLARPSTE